MRAHDGHQTSPSPSPSPTSCGDTTRTVHPHPHPHPRPPCVTTRRRQYALPLLAMTTVTTRHPFLFACKREHDSHRATTASPPIRLQTRTRLMGRHNGDSIPSLFPYECYTPSPLPSPTSRADNVTTTVRPPLATITARHPLPFAYKLEHDSRRVTTLPCPCPCPPHAITQR